MSAVQSGWMNCRLARVMLVVFVCLTAAVSLAWSHAKLFSQDEMYQFQTDSVGSLAELVHVQTTWPISLDPLLDHALAHAAIVVFGANPFAERLPALLGFLLMQVCLFFLVRRWAGDRAGVVAAAFPAVTATLYYSAEGRPYGLLLGLYALALLCWQRAGNREQGTGNREQGLGNREQGAGNREQGLGNSRRGWALVGLAVAIAATINAHYFGILLLVPVCAAEAWRTLERRRIDWPVVAAIVVGMAGILGTRPFMKAAGEFRKHYYNGGGVGLHDISRAYRTLFVDYTQMAIRWQHVWMVVLVLSAAGLVWCCWRVANPTHGDATASHGVLGSIGAPGVRMAHADWVLLLALAALPFCGYLLARFVTHSIEVRYVLGALVALSAMLALAVSPWLRRDAVFNAVLAVLGLGIVLGGVVRVRAEQRKTDARLASLVMPAEVKSALASSADGRLYVQDMGAFEEDRYYEPDAAVKSAMTLVYSSAEELRWNRHDTMALTAMHMQHFTGLPVVSYEALKAQPGEHIFVLFHTGWDWTDQAFAADGAQVRPVGKAMGGDVVAVRFH